MSENEHIATEARNPEAVSKEEQYSQVMDLFGKLSDLQSKPFYQIAEDMAYLQDKVALDEPLDEFTLYTLACKLDEAGGSYFQEPMLHEERLDAVRYMLENGINERHSPYLPELSPNDTLKFLLSADMPVFGALVEMVATDNQNLYAVEGNHQDVDLVINAIEAIQDRYSLAELITNAFKNMGKEKDFASGPYSLHFDVRPTETLFMVSYNDQPILFGESGDKKVQLCCTENQHPYDDLIYAALNALPEYQLCGPLFELYIGNPETDKKYAGYFCGDFHCVISNKEYQALWDSGELETCDTMDYEPIFDGRIYPSQADSSAAQIAAFGYHYDDDRRKKPSLNDQVRSAAAKAAASAQEHSSQHKTDIDR